MVERHAEANGLAFRSSSRERGRRSSCCTASPTRRISGATSCRRSRLSVGHPNGWVRVRYACVEGADHWIPLSAAGAVNDLLVDFLTD